MSSAGSDIPTELRALPDRFQTVAYVGARHPCAPGVSGLDGGANCQQYAYELLRHYGLEPPALRSSELFTDETCSRHVTEPRPLDLLLFNTSDEPYGAHVAVYLGRGRAVHLSAEVGQPAVWTLQQFRQHERYRVLVAIKRVTRRRAWETPEAIAAAMRELTDSMPGWQPCAAHGVVLVPADALGTGDVQFPVVNVGAHGLPALVLGVVTGRRHETATYELDRAQLQRAVAMLAPAEAAAMYQHPNINAWRIILDRWAVEPEAQVFAVFIASLDDPVSSPYDQALRHQIAAGDRAELYRR